MPQTGRIAIDAKPEALAIDPAHSAVIVVDMQNDFGSPGGMFALAGIDIASIRNVIAPTARVLTGHRPGWQRQPDTDPGHLEYRHRRGADAQARRRRALQAPLQRLFRDRSRRHSEAAVHQEPDFHRMHHQRLHRVHAPRCDVPGLHLPLVGRLHGGAGGREHEPRSLLDRPAASLRVDFAVHAVHRGGREASRFVRARS